MASTKVVTQHKTAAVHGFKVLTDGEPDGTFEAVVSVFANVDLGGDRVVAGAFSKTLERWKSSGDPIPIIFSHQWDDLDAHVGVVKDAAELLPGDARLPPAISANGGLWIKGALDVPGADFATRLWSKMRQRAIKEFSFAYDVLQARPGQGGALDLLQLDLIEVGPTLKGMNPLTALVGVKTRKGSDVLDALDLADQLKRDLTGPTPVDDDETPGSLAAAVDSVLDEAAEALAAGDTASAAALLTAAGSTVDDLLELLGVDDPDEVADDTSAEAKRAARAERALRDVGRCSRKLAANNGKTQGPSGSPVEAESTGLHPDTADAALEALAIELSL